MFALIFKWVSVLALISTAVAIYYDVLPPYHTFSKHDANLWSSALAVLAFAQIILLACKVKNCYKCRIWSDFTLQLTGLSFVILSGVFGMAYPPFSWAMGIFPIIGILYLVVGRKLSQRSRKRLRDYDGAVVTTD